jgi:hypothetical protein
VPALQISPAAHVVPQVPQFFGSLLVLTHTPLHTVVKPAGHVHAPPTHVACLLEHTVPQAPQLFGSVVVLTHLALHTVG